ncbi:MAG: SDR family oxidoreductase [Mycobacteriaceae bacterium]
MTQRMVSGDGVSLAVVEAGDPAAPTVVCVHGYPDNRLVWEPVVAALRDRYHVVTYDVRGAGRSDKPRDRHAYHLDRLAEDLALVVDAVSPDRPVHLLAHDWGSIQAWHAVAGERLQGRVASYTSISGPSLDYAGAWVRSRSRTGPRGARDVVKQLVSSGYIGFFQLPLLPELAWRSGLLTSLMRRLDDTAQAPVLSDARHGLALYRENMLGRLSRPAPRRTDVPVQILAPTHDRFVSAAAQTDIGKWVPNLWVRSIPAGHWLPRSRPAVVARCVAELIDHVEGGPQPRALRRARVTSSPRGRFAGQLVVITGAGSGIGRATALAFAEAGADMSLTDIDEASVTRTVELARLLGAEATASVVNVADAEAMARFAQETQAERGVPDVVVNNAGIGMAGAFTQTSLTDWERIIDVNLWGVIHGCRAFVEPMVARGEGGRIVNIASAAAYLPSKMLPAYATTKSAVLTLSECLRAELAADGIGVVAVCPGFVHTNISATTRFVGTDEAEEQRRQRATTAAYRRRNYRPEKVAEHILRAVEANTAIAPITPEAKAGLLLSRLAPGLLRAAARLNLTPY